MTPFTDIAKHSAVVETRQRVNEARNLIMSGGGDISWNVAANKLKWTAAFRLMPLPDSVVPPDNNLFLSMPTSGVTNAAGVEQASADGISLQNWNSLWFVHPRGNAFNVGNSWKVLNYLDPAINDYFANEDAYEIAFRNGDNNSIYLRNGLVIPSGKTIPAGRSIPLLTDADIAAANKDGLAATPAMRTLGTGAQQAAGGQDARIVGALQRAGDTMTGALETRGDITRRETSAAQFSATSFRMIHDAVAAASRTFMFSLQNLIAGGGGASQFYLRHEKSTSPYTFRNLLQYSTTDEILHLSGSEVRADGQRILTNADRGVNVAAFNDERFHVRNHNLFSSDHPDVDAADAPANLEVLTFDAVAGKWKASPAGGVLSANEDREGTARQATAQQIIDGAAGNLFPTAARNKVELDRRIPVPTNAYVEISRSTGLTIVDNSLVTVSFDTVLRDPRGWRTTATTITVDATGLYMLTLDGAWSSSSTGARLSRFNTSAGIKGTQRLPAAFGSDFSNTTQVWLTAGQTISVDVLQGSGASLLLAAECRLVVSRIA